MAIVDLEYLTSLTSLVLNWEISSNQGEDINDLQPEYTLPTSTINESWYSTVYINPLSTLTLDLTNLDTNILGMTVSRSFSKIHSLTVENTSSDYPIVIGESGVANSINQFGYRKEIGLSGIVSSTSYKGFVVDSTHKNLGITNENSQPITCKILILGVEG